MRRVCAVVGAQYGSEGKGVIVNQIAHEFDCHVRTGGPNAGHTFWHQGEAWSQQVVPVGWTNPGATLIIGPGGLLSPELLVQEVEKIRKVDPTILERLMIDYEVGLLMPEHQKAEGGTKGRIHERIGSTGEGVGAARMGRIQRDSELFQRAQDNMEYLRDFKTSGGWSILDLLHHNTPRFIQERTVNVLLEGTQGSGLSLIHGNWPYVTSHDTNAATLAADAGIPPQCVTSVLLVARTRPIRVAGASGPLLGETSWDDLSETLGRDVEERTTVTRKVRRIGDWDSALYEHAVILNMPTSVAVTFVDYIDAANIGVTEYHELTERTKRFLSYVEIISNAPISLIGTGRKGENEPWTVIRRPYTL